MTAEVVPIITRQPVRVGYEFQCRGCLSDVYAAVHYGDAHLCLTCQTVGIPMSVWLRDRAGPAPAFDGSL